MKSAAQKTGGENKWSAREELERLKVKRAERAEARVNYKLKANKEKMLQELQANKLIDRKKRKRNRKKERKERKRERLNF